MSAPGTAALIVLLTWWASTGAVLRLVRISREAFPAAAALFGVIGGAGLVGLYVTRELTTVTGAYLAFGSAIAVWAFHELTFLLGLVTGPRRLPCPSSVDGFARFRLATSTVIHHELALAATLLLIWLLTQSEKNQVGMWTFAVLWVMRLSSKFNLFLGVRSFTEEFVPAHLRYLVTYYRRASWNPLMPVSIGLGLAGVSALLMQAFTVPHEPFTAVGRTMIATLLGLAVLEHLFLALPLRDALLWRFFLPGPEGTASQADAVHGEKRSSPVVSSSSV